MREAPSSRTGSVASWPLFVMVTRICKQKAMYLQVGPKPIPAIRAETKRTVVGTVKQTQKEIWKLEVPDHSFLVNHPVSYWKIQREGGSLPDVKSH